MNKLTSSVVGLVVLVASVCAQSPDPAPSVPLSVMVKGRQAVAANLIARVDHVALTFTGQSVVGTETKLVSAEELLSRGYMHSGSFSEISDALASIQFSREVIPTPSGYYDVRVDIKYYTKEGTVAFLGSGYLNIQQGKGGLIADEFHPWIALNYNISFTVTNLVTAAVVTSKSRGPDDLSINYTFNEQGITGSTVTMPTYMLGDGYLAVSDVAGEVTAIDLATGQSVSAQKVIALLGATSSSDIRVLRNPISFSFEDYRFYKSNGKIFGRVQLTELVIEEAMTVNPWVKVPVWGTDQVVTPDQVSIKAIFINEKGTPSGTAWDQPQGYSTTLAPGIYHIELHFSGVEDWERDPNSKG